MKILIIGDIVGSAAVDYLKAKLRKVKDALGGIDLTVANGENATEIHGISAPAAKEILECGVDLITLGNHAYGRKDICAFLSDDQRIIRPANYPPTCPGGGYTTLNVDGYKILCINVLGTALMEPLACPFDTVDRILEREKGEYDLSILDVHAEATSEKLAIGRYFDGRINIIFGTHTHVPTADEQILKGGTAYITDVGMTGPVNGIIGADEAAVIEKFRTKMPTRFTVADGEVKANCLLVEIDPESARVDKVRRVNF
ncbi:MAG: YmdB family metallophosphoesterase [Clostridia bacterium]|nr:YmdB family metallophosphoesterase [Clostridia bacterium]